MKKGKHPVVFGILLIILGYGAVVVLGQLHLYGKTSFVHDVAVNICVIIAVLGAMRIFLYIVGKSRNR